MTREWLLAVGERAVKTAAQVALLVLLASGTNLGDGVTSFDIAAVDWAEVARFAAGGAVLSILTSLASGWLNERGTPSLTRAESIITAEPQELPQITTAPGLPPAETPNRSDTLPPIGDTP